MKTVFFDVDTQLDFVSPSGALYVPGAERILPAIAQLNRSAAERGIPVISTMDAHAENDAEFRAWPPHCVSGTLGQRKAEATLLDGRVTVPNRDGAFDLRGARQVLVEKQSVNVFETRTIGRILDALEAERVIVYGVVTEVCVLHAARGLLRAGRIVAVVTDAIEGLSAADSSRALDEIRNAGGEMIQAAAAG